MKLLDTDIFIDLFRGVEDAIKFITENKEDIIFCSITEAELLSGKSCDYIKEREKVYHLLSMFEKIPVDNPLVQTAGEIRRIYGLDIPDALIVASALATDSILITRNIKDFGKVKELKVHKPY